MSANHGFSRTFGAVGAAARSPETFNAVVSPSGPRGASVDVVVCPAYIRKPNPALESCAKAYITASPTSGDRPMRDLISSLLSTLIPRGVIVQRGAQRST